MEEKVEIAVDYLCDALNMMMVLTDSLELAFHNSKNNDYQYTVAKNILNELEQVLGELNTLEGELCALKKEQV